MNADDVFDAVNRDKMFYESSAGGVTISGGELLLQPEFVSDLFEKCRRAGIHTCMESSGYAAESSLKRVLHHTDYVLYDLKYLNSEKHRWYTGKSNDLILSNAKIVATSGVETLFRMPLIPGINDDVENIEETAGFLHGLGNSALRIELMPYHRLGKGKYEAMEKQYSLSEILSPTPEHLDSIKKAFESNNIKCFISR